MGEDEGLPDPLEILERERLEPTGVRAQFDEHLATLDRLLVEVASKLAGTIGPGTRAFLDADQHAARTTITEDAAIERRCELVEDACYVLIAREQPVATDLRRIIAVQRATADVRRSGNLLRHVVESLTWVHPPSMPEELRELVGRMGTVAATMFRDAAAAWAAHDGLAANDLETADDEVDGLQKELLAALYIGRQSVEEAVSLGLIARYYERIADHAVEIGRQMSYVVTGERVRPPDAPL